MCTVGRDESAAVTLTCSEGYMLQVCLLPHHEGRHLRVRRHYHRCAMCTAQQANPLRTVHCFQISKLLTAY